MEQFQGSVRAFFIEKREVDVAVEIDWDWKRRNYIFMKEGDFCELFRIWWTICSATVERKIE